MEMERIDAALHDHTTFFATRPVGKPSDGQP